MADKNKKKLKRKKGIDAGAFVGFDTPANYIDSWGKQRQPDCQALIREYKGIGYACVNKNVQECIKHKIRLYRKSRIGEKTTRYPTKSLTYNQVYRLEKNNKIRISDKERIEEIVSHRIVDFLEHPNESLDGLNLFEFTFLFMDITGQGYWYVAEDRLGIPAEGYLMLPQYTKAIRDNQTGKILKYKYGTGENARDYLPNEVIPFLLPNPKAPLFDGYSPMYSVYESMNIQNKYAATEAAILDNDGRPAGILSAKDGLAEDEAIRWERKFNNKFRRAGNGGVLVMEEDANFQPLSYNPRDLARLEIYSNAKTAICNAYGVPVALLSETGASQYGVQATLRQQHVEDAIIPRLRRIESVLNHYLIPKFDDSGKLFLAFDDPSVENEEIEIKRNDTYVKAGIWTPNEVRIKLGQEPRPDGDRLANPIGTAAQADIATDIEPETPAEEAVESTAPERGEQEIQTLPDKTLNGMQISSAMQIVQSVAQGTLARDTGLGSLMVLLNLTEEQAETVLGSAGNEPVKEPPKPEPPKPDQPDNAEEEQPEKSCDCGQVHKAHIQGHNKKLPDGKELAAVLKKFFSKQKAEVIGGLNKHKSIQKNIPDRFIHLEKWDRELYQECQPVIELYYKNGYEVQSKEIIGRTGIDPDRFNVVNPHVKDKINKLTLKFCKETNETTSRDLNKALSDLREEFEHGLSENIGDRPAELVDRVKDIFDSAEDFRAERIAMTESSRATHEAQRQSAKDSGVVKGFNLLLSTAACEQCQAVAAEGMIGLDDSFTNDDSAPEGYQDRFVPIHPNCECTIEMVLDTDERG